MTEAKDFLNPKDKAFWRALLGVVGFGLCIGLASLILRMSRKQQKQTVGLIGLNKTALSIL